MRDSPARSDAPVPEAWFPLPELDALPEIEELLTSALPPAEELVRDSPARSDAPRPDAWLPLPDVDALPEVDELLRAAAESRAASHEAATEVVRDSPARAGAPEPEAWLPLPAPATLPHLPDLDGAPGAASPPGRRRTLLQMATSRVGRASMAMLLVATIVGVAVAAWDTARDKPVAFALDVGAGRVISGSTLAPTVGALLKERQVHVGAADRVLPPESTPVHAHLRVHVLRAFPVRVDLDGVVSTWKTPWTNPSDLVERQLRLPAGYAVRSAPEVLQAGATVVIRQVHSGHLALDGQEIDFAGRPALTVGELLQSYSAQLGTDDAVTPPVGTHLVDGMRVTVVRVGREITTLDESYDAATVVVKEPTHDVSEQWTEPGASGVLRVTLEIVRRDGAIVEQRVLSKVPVPGEEAVATRVHQGTKAEPEWDELARCESGGNWAAPDDPDHGYSGGLGIFVGTWRDFGGLEFAPLPNLATREQQIVVGRRIKAKYGWGAWGCARDVLGWVHSS